ncbi:MAG: OmpA family protein [Actinomycetia bacterium]|nr:OmpA family protein [Actinomycetes bacterium]
MRDHDQPADPGHEPMPEATDEPVEASTEARVGADSQAEGPSAPDPTAGQGEGAEPSTDETAGAVTGQADEPVFDRDALVVAGFSTLAPPAPPPSSNTGRNVLIGVGGVLLAGLVVGIVAFNGSEIRTTPEELAVETPRARSTPATEMVEEDTSDPLAFAESTTSTTMAGQAATGRTDDQAPEATPSVGELAADRSERLAVFKGGVVYLRGRVPSQEVADTIAARAAAVVGPDNVVVEYEIDPTAPLPTGAPLYVEDLVLFAYDSTEVGPEFLPLLELGVTLLDQVPTVTVEVRGHTDGSGSDVYNLDLSQRRVDSVVAYWVSRGVDASRVTGVGFGETDLLDPANPSSKVNRRVEFIINGILG